MAISSYTVMSLHKFCFGHLFFDHNSKCGSVAQSCDRLAPFVGSRVRFPVAVLQPRGERF